MAALRWTGSFSIPTMSEQVGIMINQNMLEDAGIVIPENWTIDDFAEISRQLTQTSDGNKVYGSVLYHLGLPLNIPRTILGADYMYKNEKESNFDALAFRVNTKLKAMMDEGIAMPYDEVFARNLGGNSWAAFVNEEVAMISFAPWMLRNVRNITDYPHDFKTTFAPFPTSEKGVENPYQMILNGYLSMSTNSEHKEECWEFMKFWATEGSRYMTESGGKISIWNKIEEDEIVAAVLGKKAEEIFNVQAYRDVFHDPDIKYYVDTLTTAYPQMVAIYTEENEKYFLGGLDEETYYEQLKNRSDAAIANES